MLMGLWGWKVRLKRRTRISVGTSPVSVLNPSRLLIAGSVLTILSYIAFSIITRQTGGIIGFYSITGSYSLDWLGEEVIAVFFMTIFLNTGLVVLVFSFLLQPRMITGAMVLFALAPSIADIVILNRRSDVIYTVVAVLFPAFFVRNWAPSRSMVLIGLLLGMLVVFGFPVIRGTLLIGAERQVDFFEAFEQALFYDVLGGGTHKEFNNSIGLVASADWLFEFGLGANTWNSWVTTTIPRTFFGEEIKTFLQFDSVSFFDLGSRAFGWVPVWFQSRSAAALMFVEFWYFGSLIFFLVGYYIAHLFSGARTGRIDLQMKYTAIMLFLPHWIAVGFYKAPRNMIATLLILGAVVAYARVRKRNKPSVLSRLPVDLV